MNFQYDQTADVLYIKLTEQPVTDSEEVEPHVVVDYDVDGQIVGIEVLYFVKKHSSDLFPAFKAMEAAVWQQEYKKVG